MAQPVKTNYQPGELIVEQYKVERVVGKGGMGVVYLVHDLTTGQHLALKTLLPRFAKDAFAVRRFVREVNAVRRLKHPAIVNIYDARRIGPLMFYTMDFVEGKSVRKLLQDRSRLGFGSTVRILALLAHALEYVHQYTIHRDLSPENVMVLPDGSIRLLDFGLAKLADNQGAFTQIGVSLGKWQYTAPEQHSNAADVDLRADIFSMGIMFYEMLSGRFPEMGQSLSALDPELPDGCDAFFEKATAAFPENRFAVAREFRLALIALYEASRGGKPVAAHDRPAKVVRDDTPAAKARIEAVFAEAPLEAAHEPVNVHPAEQIYAAEDHLAARGPLWWAPAGSVWRLFQKWNPLAAVRRFRNRD